MSREDTVPAGHSSTSQWQSFEMRMRQRRAERCVQRAEAALEAGDSEDARAAVEEARLLDATVPEFETLRAEFVEREQAATRRDRARSIRRLAFAAAIIVISVVGISVWLRDRSPLAPVAVATAGETAPAQQTVATRVEPQPVQVAAVTEQPAVVATTNPDPADTQPLVSTPELGPASFAPSAVGREVEIAVPALPPSEKSTPDLGMPVPGLPATPLPEVAAPPAAPRPTEAAPPVDEGPRVRAALARYESAYSTLDVSAVQSIWPGVDARALARAFEGLRSQRVSLGSCSVAIDGASARADCTGTASWTPKIGGGTQGGSRSWQFELRKVDDAWQIVRADVR